MADTLVKQAQFLSENGFTEQQANALVYFQRDTIENVMATKKDIADVRKEIADVRKEVEQLRADMTKEIADVRKEIEQLRADMTKDIALLKKDLTLKLGSIMTAGIILLGILIKF